MGATVGSAIGSIGLASVRDLRWRTRRFLVAAIAAGLVFGVALMGSGIATIGLTRERSDGTEETLQEIGPGAYFGSSHRCSGCPGLRPPGRWAQPR